MLGCEFIPVFARARGKDTVQLNPIAKLDKTASSDWGIEKQHMEN